MNKRKEKKQCNEGDLVSLIISCEYKNLKKKQKPEISILQMQANLGETTYRIFRPGFRKI